MKKTMLGITALAALGLLAGSPGVRADVRSVRIGVQGATCAT
jgi:hypothetical protein